MAKKNKKDGIYQFLSPDASDEIIKKKIQSASRKGGKGSSRKWTDAELAIRRSVILEYLTENNVSRFECCKQISARWGIAMSTANTYIRDALEALTADNEEFIESARTKHIERLEKLLQEATENHFIDAQLKVLDQLAKVEGLYENKQKVELTGTDITFKFGD